MNDFSDRGEPLTEFELRLIREVEDPGHWLVVARRLATELGAVAGGAALAVLLDEFGTEKIHVPSRRQFFQKLWRTERDEIIERQLHVERRPHSEIAGAAGISRSRVTQLAARTTRTPGCGKGGR